jgi:glycine betaine catabolism B
MNLPDRSISASIIGRRVLAKDTYEITLSLPEVFHFTPGQYVGLTIPTLNVLDPHAKRRDLSIVSLPGTKQIILALRSSSSPFKQSLLSENPPLQLRGPHGIFTVPTDNLTPLTFISGGIGITPFMSILSAGVSAPVSLLSVDSSPERVAFAPELSKLASHRVSIKDRLGRINSLLELQTEIPIDPTGLFYLSGPPTFTSHLRELLREAGVPPFSINMEEFTGYGSID